MSDIAGHYGTEGIVQRILAAIGEIGEPLEPRHFYPFDQLHGRELLATKDHAALLEASPSDTILDIGCGIGGPARYIASTFGCSVNGIDITPAFVTAAQKLTELCGLQDRVTFVEGNAEALPFEAGAFDGGISLYVGMNLPNREAVIREAARVIRPGGRLVWSEAVLKTGEVPHYPLPWAAVPENSFMVSEKALITLFENAGFHVDVNDETSSHVELARQRAASGVVPTAAHREANEVVLGKDLLERRKSYIANLVEGRLAAIVISAMRSK